MWSVLGEACLDLFCNLLMGELVRRELRVSVLEQMVVGGWIF